LILLDTSVVLEVVEGGAGLKACIDRLEPYAPDQVAVSVVTVFEVEAGLFDGSPDIKARRQKWERLQSLIGLHAVYGQTARKAAQIVRTTSAKGQKLGNLDALIAAVAMENDLVLCTRDRDFLRVPGLRFELWR
jgi:predicted nucleic acid-binding protein